MTLPRLHSLMRLLMVKLGKAVWFALDGQGMSYISVTESSDEQRVLVNDLGMADTIRWLEHEVGAGESALPDCTVDQLREHFEDARDRLLAEYRMRQQVFPEGHPQRYAKLQDIRIILQHLSWMKDLLKPLAIVPPQQQRLLTVSDDAPKDGYTYH